VNYIEELKEVIHKLHGTEATHVETVPVKETFQGQTVWGGDVEVFDLADHPKASRVYAWSHETSDPENPRQAQPSYRFRQLQRRSRPYKWR
jgi:hypothetical protein